MDPTNNLQPSVNPGAGVTPTSGAAPGPTPVPGAGVAPEVAAPGVGAVPVAPGVVAAPAPVVAPAPGAVPAPAAPEMAPAAVPVAPAVAPQAAVASQAPVVSQPPAPAAGTGVEGLSLTDPIMRPDLPAAPDPVEQELKAPLTASGPVVGSIGSAVSVGADGVAVDATGQPITDPAKFGANAGGAMPNVAFNDPAAQPDAKGKKGLNKQINIKLPKIDFKKMNRGVLVTAIVIAAIVIVALVVVLIMQLIK